MNGPVLNNWEERSPTGNEMYRIRHTEFGVVVTVEAFKSNNAYKIKIKNPRDSAVEMLSIGPDLTEMIHEGNKPVFTDQSEAELNAKQWAAEVAQSNNLATMTGSTDLER